MPNGEELIAATLEGEARLVVVNLDQPESMEAALPIGFPGVLVGVRRSAWPAPAPGSRGPSAGEAPESLVDIVLVPEGTAPSGASHGQAWVAVADVDDELARLGAAVKEAPIAATALVQVLRAGQRPSIDDDLFVESLAYSVLQGGPEHRAWLAGRVRRSAQRQENGPAVVLHREGPTLTVTLNRPSVRNAYNVDVREGLFEAFALAALDASVEVVRLVGKGSDFCSGGDLDEFGTGPNPAASHLIRTNRGPASALARVSDKVIVELHGACVGAGIELPALAGRVVARLDTRIRLPEVSMGLIPGAGGTASLPRRMGRHRTAWLALSGTWLSAPTALAWGLVDQLL